jgi:acyl-coenzyme A synthetase/AMP-(fatty) acid ligase
MHTPYGMTEVLPIADISLDELRSIEDSSDVMKKTAGVCVGYPLTGVQIVIDPLADNGLPCGQYTTVAGVLGEIIVRADHCRHRYDRLWHTDYLASIPIGAHRSGDIGQLDANGRLWVGGRLQHVITSPDGPVAPVAAEQRIEALAEVEMAALLGVGPPGVQAIVAVIQQSANPEKYYKADLTLTDRVRHSVADYLDIAAVLVVQRLPVDKRHNSKVDRTAVAAWATRVLAGDKVAAL